MAAPVITITRQYASGGSEVARLVAGALGWTVIYNEFVDQVAERAGLPAAEVAQLEVLDPGLRARLARKFVAASPRVFAASADAPPVAREDAPNMLRTEGV